MVEKKETKEIPEANLVILKDLKSQVYDLLVVQQNVQNKLSQLNQQINFIQNGKNNKD